LLFVLVIVVLGYGAIARAQTWTGLASPDNNWITLNNWDTAVPVSTNTAVFNGAGNGNTSISLGNTSQPIKNIQFDTAGAAGYTLGVLSSGDKFNVDAGGAITVTSSVTTPQLINADIQANGALTINNSSPTGSLTIAGNISGSGASLSYGGAANGVTLLTGQSTYSGTTAFNVVSGNLIQVGSSSNSGPFTSGPFGTSTLVSTSGNNSPFQAFGADRVIANPFTLNFGFTISNAATPFNMTLSGPLTSTATGKTLTINTPGQITTLGLASSPSTITLSTTASNTLALDTSLSSTLVINDVIQDGTVAGGIIYNSIGNNTPEGTMQINGANTYSGTTSFGNQTSGTFAALFTQINVATTGSPGSIVSGPFGKGTVSFANTNAPVVLQPFGADRTVANAITLNAGFFAQNPSAVADPSGSHSLTLSGPVTMGTTGRTVTNNLVAGTTLNIGSSASPNTMTLSNTLQFQTQAASGVGGGVTVINDTVVNGTANGGLTVQNNATLTLTAANTYSGTTTVQGTGSPLLLVNNASGSGTGTGFVSVKAGALGGIGTIAPTVATTGTVPFQVTVSATGSIAPGSSGIGTLTFDSTSANGPLMAFAGGTTITEELGASHQSDKIALINGAAGDITFGGNAVNFTDLTGGSLASGSYPIITSDVAGAYTGLTVDGSGNITGGLTIGTGLSAYPTAVLQQIGNNIVLTIPAAGLPGDFNSDGKVDAGDYATWRKNEVANSSLPNDGGATDQATRFTLWRANFGNPPGAGSSLGGPGAVPEPASILLVVVGIAVLSTVGTRRRAAI
jgi:autotransporter-associated beta strand protein